MVSPSTAGEFLALVKKSGVLDEKRLNTRFSDPDELPADPTECANELIRAGLLTTFQARQILAGKYRGLVLGVYKVLRPIGQGGMGVVYLGEHTSLQRRVALKILTTKQAQQRQAVERFMREARAAAALDHANIVRLHDVSQGAGVHFLVMEYVEGKDLQTLLTETGPLHFATAVSYIAQAAAGLQHAHEKGFVHRDIKPANLMITKDGVVKILDMGLARSVFDERDNLTGALDDADAPLGTIDFVSPEQALGQPVDERGDIYSLGATLYSLITGQSPYKGTRPQILMQHQMAEPPRLSKALRVSVPPSLNDVIAKMMAKKKTDRYQSAEEAIDALAPWLPAPQSKNSVDDSLSTQELREAGVAPQKKRASTKKGRKRKAREAALRERKKWYAIGGVAAAVLLLGTVIAVASGGKKQPPPAPPVAPTAGTTQPPAAVRPTTPEESQLLLTTTAQVNDITLSLDGTRFAAVDWSGNLLYGPTSDWQKLNSVRVHSGSLNCCAPTPDGKHIVVGGRQMFVQVHDWKTGQKVGEFPGHSDTTWGVAVSRAGNRVATCGNDGIVVLRNFPGGEEIRRHEFEAKQVWSVAFSPDGSLLAASCSAGSTDEESHQIRLWDVATGRELLRLTSAHTGDVRHVTFSPDGRTLASAGFDGMVRLWDIASGKQTQTINAHGGHYAERVAFTPNGKHLVSGGAIFATGSDNNGAVRVWDVATGQEVRTWRGWDAKSVIALAVAPNGGYVLTGSREKTVRLWKLP